MDMDMETMMGGYESSDSDGGDGGDGGSFLDLDMDHHDDLNFEALLAASGTFALPPPPTRLPSR
jgi:hypothetical protein